METYRSGHNGADSKSVSGQPHVGSNPTVSAKKELLLGYESVLIMVLFCCIFHFFRQQGCIPPLAAFSYTVIVAFVGNRGIIDN